MKKIVLIGSTIASFLLYGCGSSDSTDSSTTTYSGYFIDSAVENVNYKTDTYSDVTDSDGQYNYKKNETVTFSIGSITLGTVTATETITPLTLANSTSTSNETVINIARFLQTLDSDQDTSNGINISDSVKNAATTDIDFTQSVEEFASDSEVLNVISTVGESELIDEDTAISHLESTLDDIETENDPSIGTWANIEENEDGDLESIVVISMLDDGTYLAGQVSGPVYDDSTDGDDEFGGGSGYGYEQCVGFEFAEYSIDEVTQEQDFMNVYYDSGFDEADKINDSDITVYDHIAGTIGYYDSFERSDGLQAAICGIETSISSNAFQSRFEDSSDAIWYDDSDENEESISNFAYYIDNGIMHAYSSEVTGEDYGDLEQYTPELDEQITTDDNPLIGTWLHSSHTKLSSSEDTLENDILALIFTDSGYYVYMDSSAVDDAQEAGIEVGKYSYDASNGTVTMTELLTMTSEDGVDYDFDYNGNHGFSGFYDEALSVTISNGEMNITIPDDNEYTTRTFIYQ